jgi:hypothetical protein
MLTRWIWGCSVAGSEAAMDARIGRMPWVLAGLFFAATASAAPGGFLVESPAIEQKPTVDKAIPPRSAPKLLSPAPAKTSAAVKTAPRPVTPAEPAPPPDLPPSEIAPAGAGFAVPTIGDVYVPEAPVLPELPLGIAPPRIAGPDGIIVPDEASAEDNTLTIDAGWRGGDIGLATLCGLPGITSLTLKNAPLTDAALDHIAAIPNLRTLHIEGNTFSARALARFRAQRPTACVVARGNSPAVRSAAR